MAPTNAQRLAQKLNGFYQENGFHLAKWLPLSTMASTIDQWQSSPDSPS
uniref:Uncharacterized protein n=1 Tax=Anguilla anguilla TaxID=7936 RepID=A0A0E9XEP2_ANGAN